MKKQNDNSIMPKEWRIKFKSTEYAAYCDSKVLGQLSRGEIKEPECIKSIEDNNDLETGTITHDQLIANLIWTGYWNVYKSNHDMEFNDMVIEMYFNNKRAALRDACL